jgi:SAM-dependent methyltransferase
MKSQTVKSLIDSPPAAVRSWLKRLAVSYCKLFKSSRTFRFQGCDYHYFYHSYNLAWRNERSVELPIARRFLSEHAGDEILEVGNVLSHYLAVEHDILDKYEVSDGVINEDALHFNPGKKYDLILSISTLEHMGWDEYPLEPGKAVAVITNLARLLNPGGELVATFPLGYNPELDRLLEQKRIPFTKTFAMRRTTGKNEWTQADFASVLGTEYRKSRFRADAIGVGVLKKEQVENTGGYGSG